ncbi:MAG: hypothetical protein GX267_18115 [Fibrobacter sp.]|jgi:hypothetical protein|nr:hypothetical protein [Fibrobacter sp.]
MRRKDIDELSTEMVEWINGERISLEEYEARISAHINVLAGSYLLKTNSDLNWIFGLS